MKATFCYRIAKEAGLAENYITGEPAETYASFSLRDDNEDIIDVSTEKYAELHQQGIKSIAGMADIDESMVEKISIEEYEAVDEEDD